MSGQVYFYRCVSPYFRNRHQTFQSIKVFQGTITLIFTHGFLNGISDLMKCGLSRELMVFLNNKTFHGHGSKTELKVIIQNLIR